MLVGFFVFIIMLVLYIHIQAQYKKGEDLEVYEMDYVSKDQLKNVCDMKQPVLFGLPILEGVIKVIPDIELPVWDIREYYMKDSVDPIYLSYSSFMNLAKSDPKGYFFTRKNRDSLDLEKEVFDDFLRPPLTIHSDYELICGSSGVSTPLQYHMDDRLFLFVKSGKISVKMTPWRSRRYLTPVNDYENYEFYSKTNVWIGTSATLGPNKDIKWLDFEVVQGYVLSIPPWWWYSIRFSSVDTEVVGIRYVTAVNAIAHIPDWTRYYMHLHMTQKIPITQMEINKLIENEEPVVDAPSI